MHLDFKKTSSLQSVKELQTNKEQIVSEGNEDDSTDYVVDSSYQLRRTTVILAGTSPE